MKATGNPGFADIWKRGFFAFEYKMRKKNLKEAQDQLARYSWHLENPPIHVACDTNLIRVITAFNNAPTRTFDISLDDLANHEKRAILEAVFHAPERLRGHMTREMLTREAADAFSAISERLQHRHPDREAVAHFVNQLVFCFFAEDVRLLPEGLFKKQLLGRAARHPVRAKQYLDDLFAAMESPGGEYALHDIAWFNGGLFDGRRAFPLEPGEIDMLVQAAGLNWSEIDPTIFGTLFERLLDPDKRAQIGAHYTDETKIMMIVEPVIMRPLTREWEAAKAEIEGLLAGRVQPPKRAAGRGKLSAKEAAEEARARFLARLASLSILDPACGSGNFLYLALQAVKDLELHVNTECEALGLPTHAPIVGPEILHGIEINPLAAELARTTIWIGHIQWGIRNAFYTPPSPILRKLDTIECRDALIAPAHDGAAVMAGPAQSAESRPSTSATPKRSEGVDGRAKPGHDGGERSTPLVRERSNGGYVEAEWPEAEFIIGNPPFLGGKLMRRGLGDDYVGALFEVFEGRIPPEADLVTYWFEKARAQIASGKTKRAGLVTTNSIRGGANRRVLERVVADAPILEALSDEEWTIEGAAVRVSLICFAKDISADVIKLDGAIVPSINTDLTGGGSDLTKARRLEENEHVAFMGDTKGGAFDVPGEVARAWLQAPLNPNGRPNSDVLKPWVNGLDVTRRPRDMWIIDFGWEMSEAEAALYEEPFAYALEHIKPERIKNRRESYARFWWRHVEPRPRLRRAVSTQGRYLATPRVARHRFFVWLPTATISDSRIFVFVRDDDSFFGILESRFHGAWTLGTCSWHGIGNDPTYNNESVFETFPFPEGLTPNIPAADYADDPHAICIAKAAKELDERRRAWLNPPDLVVIEPEVVPGYPDRVLPKDDKAAAVLKTRTLTNLYNERPTWLDKLHHELDRAVAAAYGWPEDISTEDALGRLLDLNLQRASAARKAAE